jgi:hypothetical protein
MKCGRDVRYTRSMGRSDQWQSATLTVAFARYDPSKPRRLGVCNMITAERSKQSVERVERDHSPFGLLRCAKDSVIRKWQARLDPH